MTFLEILRWAAIAITLLTGIYSMIKPGGIKGFTGLEASSPRAVTEIRAVMGGTFIGLAVAAFVLNTPEVFKMLGITYAVIAVIRTVSMALDKSVVRSNVISLITEIGLALILVM